MSSTETDDGRTMAGALYDDAIAPLCDTRRAAGQQPYFPATCDAAAGSYFEAVSPRAMTPADFEFPGGGEIDGFVAALAQLWNREGETDLAVMAPRLEELARVLQAESDEGDGDISILCYTMF